MCWLRTCHLSSVPALLLRAGAGPIQHQPALHRHGPQLHAQGRDPRAEVGGCGGTVIPLLPLLPGSCSITRCPGPPPCSRSGRAPSSGWWATGPSWWGHSTPGQLHCTIYKNIFDNLTFNTTLRLFVPGKETRELPPGHDFSFLLKNEMNTDVMK